MHLARLAPVVAIALALTAPTAAHADIFAAVNVRAPAPRTDFDVAVVNATLGARVVLPAGVNTTANETHPDISNDGKRLVFERIDPSAGTTRIVMFDISTGQSADLFTGFEVAARTPSDPAITPNGETVATGGPFTASAGGGTFFPDLMMIDVSNFPAGPFQKTFARTTYGFGENGIVFNPDFGANARFTLIEARSGLSFFSDVILQELGTSGSSPPPLSRTGVDHMDAAVIGTSTQRVLLEEHPRVNGGLDPGNITFRPASRTAFPLNSSTPLPGNVNTARDESQPAATPDGRFIGFVRRAADGHDRLFVWDSETQTILNSNGVDLGTLATRPVGNVGMFVKLLIAGSTVKSSGGITVNLFSPTGVGLLVQRIVGRHRVLGRPAFKLRQVGRVPLGAFKRGRGRTQWDLEVNGKPLKPGRYLVTPRAVTRRLAVRELGKPRVIRITRSTRRP